VELPDVTLLDDARRERAALAVKALHDIEPWPELAWFNTAPCERHAPDRHPLCRRCGMVLRRHQRTGAAFLYVGGKELDADTVGPQPLDAKVLTPGGWAEMGSLQPGTQVIDPDGDLSQVAEVIPQGVQDVYRITFSDGTTAESTLGHLWKVRGYTGSVYRYKTRVSREPREADPWRVRPLGEIAGQKRGQAVPLIRKAPDLAIPDRFLPVDPYLLGLLLGDGSLSGMPSFGSADAELLKAAQELLPEGWGWNFDMSRTSCEWYRLNGSQPVLRQLGLLGKRSWEKMVPGLYKWASAAARLALLQGLLDTDGNWAGCAGAEFSSASRQLAGDVADLGRSLGLRTSAVRVKRSSYRDKKTGELVRCRDSYRLTIAPGPGLELFRLERKNKPPPRQRTSGDLTNAGKRSHWERDQRVKWIRKVEYSRTVPVQCIRVSAPSGLYVTDGWTVTHNSGKTATVCALLAMCKEHGELGYDSRAVIVCPARAQYDPWAEHLARLLPGIDVLVADGDRASRLAAYMGAWEVCVVSDRTFAPAAGEKQQRAGDLAVIRQFPVATLVYDDVDAVRNHKSRTYWAITQLAARCSRVIGVNATPVSKQLMELYNFGVPAGISARLGSRTRVQQRYVTRRSFWITRGSGADGRQPVRQKIWVDNGIVRNPELIREFREAIAPLVLRRTAADFDDVTLPAVQHNPVHLDLAPAQRERYDELRRGVLRRLTAGGEQVTYAEAAAAYTRGWQICSGLAALDGRRGDVSAKLDWVMSALTGDLSEDKVVCFVHFRENVAALAARLRAADIGHVLFWSAETDKKVRRRRLDLFREDPAIRVLVGTTAIEASLNLQVARHLIAVDSILNPARMTQLLGRICRDGSPFGMVIFTQLLALATQEDGILPMLRREQEVSDVVFDETGLIPWQMSPQRLMRLVAYGSAAA